MKLASRAASAAAGLAALGLVGCGAVKVSPTGAGSESKPGDCKVEFLRKKPVRPFVELGELQSHVTVVPPGGALSVLRPKACELGADAVIVKRDFVTNEFGHTLVAGVAIRYTGPAPQPPPPPVQAPPPAPAQPPAPQSPPPELPGTVDI